MNNIDNSVYISYKWGGESERIVDEIEKALQEKGISLIRDKRALGYKDSIKDFMKRIGMGSCIIVVISDRYLRSKNCMFELLEIASHQDFFDRIFPIVLGDADIYDPVTFLGYVKYWEDKISDLDEAMKTVSQANLQGIRDDIDLYDEIRDQISSLTDILEDMNTLTPEMHENSDFQILIDAIEKRMKNVSAENIAQKEPLDVGRKPVKNASRTVMPRILLPAQPWVPEMILIPAKPFGMGSDPARDEYAKQDEQPRHTIELPDYYIARTPVTNAQYQAFVLAERYQAPDYWEGGKPPVGKERHPVVRVSWYDAMAYCHWLESLFKNDKMTLWKPKTEDEHATRPLPWEKTLRTGFYIQLPSEAEWEKAARGPTGRMYPWGNAFEIRRCNTHENGIMDTTPVDQHPDGISLYGIQDMSGNVWEWTRSIYDRYPYDAKDGRENVEPRDDVRRVFRGGSYIDPKSYARCSCRYRNFPNHRRKSGGFRIVFSSHSAFE